MQVYCTRCGYQFQVAGQGPVYCPRCGVLLGPAPPPPSGEQTSPRSADPASGVPGSAPPGYGTAAYGPPGYPPPSQAAAVPAPGTVPLPQPPTPSMAGAAFPHYGFSPALVAAPAVAAKADRRLRRRARLLRTALITLAVLVVVGGGAALLTYARAQQVTQVNASPTPAIRLPSGFVEFSDPGGIFACGVPSAWEQVSSSSSDFTLAEFGDPVHQTTLSIQYTPDSTLDEVSANDQALAQLAGSYSGGKLSGKVHGGNGTFGGEGWAKEDATLTYAGASGRVSLRIAALSAVHEVMTGNAPTRYVVTILEVAPAATFAATNTNDFQVVQESFVFEK